jgi:hypothetical protein
MTRVEGVEQCSCLNAPHFSENDAVRPPTESRLQEIIERDRGFEGICLTFDGQNIRLLDAKLRGILDDYDALMLGNRLGQNLKESRFSTPGSAADEQCLSSANLLL